MADATMEWEEDEWDYDREIAEEYQGGMSVDRIAHKRQISPQDVRDALEVCGIKPKGRGK